MADIVTRQVRSRMMANIRGKNTKPERLIRSGLHALGFRFRLHPRHLPGRPDIVLPKYGVAIFVHGCFWHRHPGCKYATMPATRSDFWRKKFVANVNRDERKSRELVKAGWRVVTVWECALRQDPADTVSCLASIIRASSDSIVEIPKTN